LRSTERGLPKSERFLLGFAPHLRDFVDIGGLLALLAAALQRHRAIQALRHFQEFSRVSAGEIVGILVVCLGPLALLLLPFRI
jgi:hypothetical protein